MSLIEHLERHLGPIEDGWGDNKQYAGAKVSVARYVEKPFENTKVLTTLGLSSTALSSDVTGKKIRLELMLFQPSDVESTRLVSILFQIAEHAIVNDHAFLRGEVIGPIEPIVPNSKLEGFYVSAPFCFPDTFHSFRYNDEDTIIALLIPITRREANFIAQNGWNEFENRLSRTEIDLIDYFREEANLSSI